MAYTIRVNDGQSRLERLRDVLNWCEGPYLVTKELGENGDNPHFHAVVYTAKEDKQVRNKCTKGIGGGNKVFSCKKAPEPKRMEQYICKGTREEPPVVAARQGIEYTDEYIKGKWEAYWVEHSLVERGRGGAAKARGSIPEQVQAEMEARNMQFTSRNVLKVTERIIVKTRSMYNPFQVLGYCRTVIARNNPKLRKVMFDELLGKLPMEPEREFFSDDELDPLEDPDPVESHADEAYCEDVYVEARQAEDGTSDAWEAGEQSGSPVPPERQCADDDHRERGVCPVPAGDQHPVGVHPELHGAHSVVRPVQDRLRDSEVLPDCGPVGADGGELSVSSAVLGEGQERPDSPESGADEGAQRSEDRRVASRPTRGAQVQAQPAHPAVPKRRHKRVHPRVEPVDQHGRSDSTVLHVEVEHRQSDEHELQGGRGDHRVHVIQERDLGDWRMYA